MQLFIADEADPIAAVARLAQGRLRSFEQRVPIELDHALAFAAADQHVEALHRHIKFERLHPFDSDAQRIVVAQVIELGAILPRDRFNPHRLTPPVSFGALAFGVGECRKPSAGRVV
jgi:hypothetical protein